MRSFRQRMKCAMIHDMDASIRAAPKTPGPAHRRAVALDDDVLHLRVERLVIDVGASQIFTQRPDGPCQPPRKTGPTFEQL